MKKTDAIKVLSQSLRWLLAIGMVLVMGFFSFAGALLLGASMGVAVAAFYFGGFGDGEVFFRNITDTFEKVATENYLRDSLLGEKLDELISVKDNVEKSIFLRMYRWRKNEIQDLEEAIHEQEEKIHHAKDANEENELKTELRKQEVSLKTMKKRLALMHEYFYDFVNTNESPGGIDDPFVKGLKEVFNLVSSQQLAADIKQKIRFTRLCGVMSLLVGGCTFFVAMGIAQSSIITFATYFGFLAAISGIGMSVGVFVLAGIFAAAFMATTYNNLFELVEKETFRKWAKDHLNSNLKPLKAIGIFIMIGLGVFMTIATVSTWVSALPVLVTTVTWLPIIIVALLLVVNLLFYLSNALKTIKEVGKILNKVSGSSFLTKIWERFKDKARNLISRENFFQIINPFRFIILIVGTFIKFLTFSGHILAAGFAADRLQGVPAWLISLLCSVAEVGQDLTYFLPKDSEDNQAGEEKGHKKEPGGCAHNHAKTTLIERVVTILLTPLYCLSALWACITSWPNEEGSRFTLKEAWAENVDVWKEFYYGEKPHGHESEVSKHYEQLLNGRVISTPSVLESGMLGISAEVLCKSTNDWLKYKNHNRQQFQINSTERKKLLKKDIEEGNCIDFESNRCMDEILKKRVGDSKSQTSDEIPLLEFNRSLVLDFHERVTEYISTHRKASLPLPPELQELQDLSDEHDQLIGFVPV